MDRKRIWGWMFFDWATQPFATLLTTFIFSLYFAQLAQSWYGAGGLDPAASGAAAQSLWGTGQAISGLIIAIGAPILGAIADQTGRRRPWIWLFSAMFVIGTSGLWWLSPAAPNLTLALVLYGIGLIGMEWATIFTNAMLPSVVGRDGVGKLSGSGFAFGYIGGVVSLVLVMALLIPLPGSSLTLIGIHPILGLDPVQFEGTRATGPFTALWFIVFMVPFALWVHEDPTATRRPISLSAAWTNLRNQFAGLRHRRSLAAWLVSSMLARDGLNALYAFGGVYAGTILGWTVMLSAMFGVFLAISAAIISWLAGQADSRYGPKPVIIAATIALTLVCVVLVSMDRSQLFGIPLAADSVLPDSLFFALGAVIGGAGGALQAAGRTLMLRHATPGRETESFGLYALSGKATAFVAPALITAATTITGSQRIGIAPLIALFLGALWLLRWVNPEGDLE